MLSKLKVSQKLVIMIAVLLVPLAYAVYLYVSEKNTSIAFSAKELLGTEYLPPVKKTLEHILAHQVAATAVLMGDTARRDQLVSLQATVDADLREIETIEKRLGKDLDSAASLQVLKADWEAVRTRAVSGTAAESFALHSKAIASVIDLIRRVGDTSNLILDPDLDSYYLMDGVIVQIPEAGQRLALASHYAAAVASQPGESATELAQLGAVLGSLSGNVEAIRRGITVATGYNASLEGTAGAPAREYTTALAAFSSFADQKVLRTAGQGLAPGQIEAEVLKASAAVAKVYDSYLAALNDLLKKRVGGFERARLIALFTALFGVLVAIGATYLLATGITRQVNAVSTVMQKIAAGDYKARANVTSEDELGQVAKGLNGMLDNTVSLISSREERDQIQASIMKLLNDVSGVAEGDLTKEAEVSADMTGSIADSFNFMIEELRRIIGDVQETTLSVGTAANEIQATAEHLAETSQSQSLQIVDTSAAIDEMATSIRQVSENASSSALVADQSRSNSMKGAEAVGRTVRGMEAIRERVQETSKRLKRLGESSQEVGEIVDLIGDIADRTSILALNASIQAAMAGEAGRGFAVVAEEVERLAERSTNATKRIGSLIKTIQTETNEAVASMEDTIREVVSGSSLASEAGKALEEIRAVSEKLAELIQSISMAAKQQARGSEALAKAMSDISETTQQTAAGTKEAAVSIRNLTSLADNLGESVSRFKLPAKAA